MTRPKKRVENKKKSLIQIIIILVLEQVSSTFARHVCFVYKIFW